MAKPNLCVVKPSFEILSEDTDPIVVIVPGSMTLGQFREESLEMAKAKGVPILFEFGWIDVLVKPDDTISSLVRRYCGTRDGGE